MKKIISEAFDAGFEAGYAAAQGEGKGKPPKPKAAGKEGLVKPGGFRRPTAKELERRKEHPAVKGSKEAMSETLEGLGVKKND